MRSALLIALALAACDEPGEPGVRLDSATPPYGPLAGGAVIELAGANFSPTTRVMFDGREAPLVRMLDVHTLEVVTPPGSRPGDAEIVAFDTNGAATARGIFHYSSPPTITSITPTDVVFTSQDTLVTVTGTGFLDEGANTVNVLVDGVLVGDVEVLSDTQLTFTAPLGRPLVRPDVEVIDARGSATMSRAFRYRPSARGGLLLFPAFGDSLADFYDPVDQSITTIPIVTPLASSFTAVIRAEDGDYLAFDRGWRLGRIDARTTTLVDVRPYSTLFPTIVGVGTTYYAIDRLAQRIVELDPITGTTTPVTANIPCCGSFGLAADGPTLYFTARVSTPSGFQIHLTPVDTETGALGAAIPLLGPTGFHVEEMRFFNGTLYAVSRNSTFVTIDPATGVVTTLPIPAKRYKAMETFE